MSKSRRYPAGYPVDGKDSRFTFGLFHDVARVLESHGYPELTGADYVELQQALFRFLYDTTQEEGS